MCSSPNNNNSLNFASQMSVLSYNFMFCVKEGLVLSNGPVVDKTSLSGDGIHGFSQTCQVDAILIGFVKSLTISGWQMLRKKTIAVGQYASNTFCLSSIFSFG